MRTSGARTGAPPWSGEGAGVRQVPPAIPGGVHDGERGVRGWKLAIPGIRTWQGDPVVIAPLLFGRGTGWCGSKYFQNLT